MNAFYHKIEKILSCFFITFLKIQTLSSKILGMANVLENEVFFEISDFQSAKYSPDIFVG